MRRAGMRRGYRAATGPGGGWRKEPDAQVCV